jgi:hypothetical protein
VTETGSGLDLYRHRSELRVAVTSNPLKGAFDEDGWYESFLGPVTPILLGSAMAVIGTLLAFGRAGRATRPCRLACSAVCPAWLPLALIVYELEDASPFPAVPVLRRAAAAMTETVFL